MPFSVSVDIRLFPCGTEIVRSPLISIFTFPLGERYFFATSNITTKRSIVMRKTPILAEINSIQPTIKELRKYDKYCKDIKDRSESMQNNLDNFYKDIQKEKDNSRSQ